MDRGPRGNKKRSYGTIIYSGFKFEKKTKFRGGTGGTDGTFLLDRENADKNGHKKVPSRPLLSFSLAVPFLRESGENPRIYPYVTLNFLFIKNKNYYCAKSFAINITVAGDG